MLRKASTCITSSIETELPVLPFLAPRTLQLSKFSGRSYIERHTDLPKTRKQRRNSCLTRTDYHNSSLCCKAPHRTGIRTRTRSPCVLKQYACSHGEGVRNRIAVSVRQSRHYHTPYLQYYASSLGIQQKCHFHCRTPGLSARTRSPGFAKLTCENYATVATSHKYVPVPVEKHGQSNAQWVPSDGYEAKGNTPHSRAGQHWKPQDKTEILKQIKSLISEDTMTVAHIPGAIPYDFNPHISERQPPSKQRSVFIKGEVIPKKKGRHEIHSKLWSGHNVPYHRGQIWPTLQNFSALSWFVDSGSGDLRYESVPLFWAKAMSVLIVREDWRLPDWIKKQEIVHHQNAGEWLRDLKKYGQDVASIRRAYSEWSMTEREERLIHVMLKVMDEAPGTILWMLQATDNQPALNRYLVANSLQLFVEQHLEKEPKFAKNVTHPVIDEILDTIDMLDESAKTLSQKTLYLLISRSNAQQLLRLHNIVDRLGIFCHGHTYLFLAYASSLHGRPEAAVKAVLNACETGVGKAADSLQSVCCAILAHAKIRDDKYEDMVGWMSEILSSGIPMGPYLFDTIIDTIAIKGDLRHAMFLVKEFEKARKHRMLYSAYASLLSGCETCPDGQVVDEVLEMVVESELAMSYPKVATQLLYVNYLYHFQHKDDRFFDAMLRVFGRFYSLDPLLDLGLVTRGEAELSQPAEYMKMLPSGFVMSIMIMAWLQIQRYGAMKRIEAIYNKFRELVENGHHTIGRLTERDYIYRAFISAFGRQRNGLGKCADIVRDMDRPLPSTAYWRAAGRPLVQIKPTVGTWNVLAEAFFRNGEENAALLILDEMRKRDLRPTIDTYNKFLKGYAHLQDFGGIKFILAQMRNDSIELNNDSLERLAKVRDQRRLAQVLNKVDYASSDQVEMTDTDDQSFQYFDNNKAIGTKKSDQANIDEHSDTNPKYEELPAVPQSLSYEEWLAERPERPERPERVSNMWSFSSSSSPQWNTQPDEDLSESYHQQETLLSKLSTLAGHETDQLNNDEHVAGSRVESLLPENNDFADADVDANVDEISFGTQDDRRELQTHENSSSNVISAIKSGVKSGIQDNSHKPQVYENSNNAKIDEVNAGSQNDTHGPKTNETSTSESSSRLDIIFRRTDSGDDSSHVSDGSSKSSTEQSEIHNSSGISILEDASILTPSLPKWRAVERIFNRVKRHAVVDDPDLDYFASVSMEEDSLELEEWVSKLLQQGNDVPKKCYRYEFTKAYEIFRQLDGDLFSPWIIMEDYIRPTREFTTLTTTAPPTPPAPPVPSASEPSVSEPLVSEPSLDPSLGPGPDPDQKPINIRAYVVKSRPRRQLSAKSTSKSPSFIRFKFGTYVQSLFNPGFEPERAMSLKDIAVQRAQNNKARVDKEFEYSDEQEDKKRGRDFMRSVKL